MVKYIIILLFLPKSLLAQQGEGFGYIIKKDFLKNHGSLYLVNAPGTQLSIQSKRLFANIEARDKNEIYLNFWDIKDEKYTNDSYTYSKNFNRAPLKFVIDHWDTANFFSFYTFKHTNKRHFISLPFRYADISALSLPFRVAFYTNSKEVRFESEFLNINLALLYNRGKTFIFENQNIKNIIRTISMGPFIGVRAINDAQKNHDWIGLNYGVVYGISRNNLKGLVALGGESSFKKGDLWILPYLSFGVGYDLYSSFEHEIENKEN